MYNISITYVSEGIHVTMYVFNYASIYYFTNF